MTQTTPSPTPEQISDDRLVELAEWHKKRAAAAKWKASGLASRGVLHFAADKEVGFHQRASELLQSTDAALRGALGALRFIDGYFNEDGHVWEARYPEMMIALGASKAEAEAKGASTYEPILDIICAVVEAVLSQHEDRS